MPHVQESQQPHRCPRSRQDACRAVLFGQPHVQRTTCQHIPAEETEDVIRPDLLEASHEALCGVYEGAEEVEHDIAGHEDVAQPSQHEEDKVRAVGDMDSGQVGKAPRHLEHVVDNDDFLHEVPEDEERGVRRDHQSRKDAGDEPHRLPVRCICRSGSSAILPLLVFHFIFQLGHDLQEFWELNQISHIGFVEQLKDPVCPAQFLLVAQRVVECNREQLCHLCRTDAIAIVIKLTELFPDPSLLSVFAALRTYRPQQPTAHVETAALGDLDLTLTFRLVFDVLAHEQEILLLLLVAHVRGVAPEPKAVGRTEVGLGAEGVGASFGRAAALGELPLQMAGLREKLVHRLLCHAAMAALGSRRQKLVRHILCLNLQFCLHLGLVNGVQNIFLHLIVVDDAPEQVQREPLTGKLAEDLWLVIARRVLD
mmetsp:Transcript_95024/g.307472  ORF Transcript_95024/g.307472 Transcript_95024/m.307472 type:complete len:425 (+) Transcript_95024:3390-4664(+)